MPEVAGGVDNIADELFQGFGFWREENGVLVRDLKKRRMGNVLYRDKGFVNLTV